MDVNNDVGQVEGGGGRRRLKEEKERCVGASRKAW